MNYVTCWNGLIQRQVFWYHCPEGKENLGVCRLAWQRMTEKYNVQGNWKRPQLATEGSRLCQLKL